MWVQAFSQKLESICSTSSMQALGYVAVTMKWHSCTYSLLVRVIALKHITCSYVCTCVYIIIPYYVGDTCRCTYNWLFNSSQVSTSPHYHAETCKPLENPSLLMTSFVIGLKSWKLLLHIQMIMVFCSIIRLTLVNFVIINRRYWE